MSELKDTVSKAIIGDPTVPIERQNIPVPEAVTPSKAIAPMERPREVVNSGAITHTPVGRTVDQSEVSKAADKAAVGVVEAFKENSDTKQAQKFGKTAADAAIGYAEAEREYAKLEKESAKYYQDLLEAQRQLDEYKRREHELGDKERRRKYHFESTAPLLELVGITEPINELLAYILSVLVILFVMPIHMTIGRLYLMASDTKKYSKSVCITFLALAILMTAAFLALLAYCVLHYGLGAWR